MLKRILTGIVAFCFILVPVVFFAHTIVLPIAIAVFALIASYEILHCVGLHKNIWISVTLYLMSGALPFALWYFEAQLVNLLSLLLCIPLLWMLAVAIFSHGKTDIRDVSTAFMLWAALCSVYWASWVLDSSIIISGSRREVPLCRFGS